MRKPGIVVIAVLSLLTLSCAKKNTETVLRMADQYGLAYAPLYIAREKGFFEEELPGVRLEWITTGNAAAIREAILAGRLDGGCMGIPPYLIGKDKGMKWQAAGALSRARLGLTTTLDNVRTLSDVPSTLRIALPQPGSIQHILLAMAAERELGDAGYFDNQLVSMNHPDGMNALLSGTDIQAHFTSPPFLQKELASGQARLVLEGNQAFGGPYTFIISVFSDEFAASSPSSVSGFLRALQRASEWINSNTQEAAGLLGKQYGIDAGDMALWLSDGTLAFGDERDSRGEIPGLRRFGEFMYAMGYLQHELP